MARSLLALFQILGTQEILLLEYAIMRFQELLQAENNNSKEEQYLESLACSWKWNNAQTELSVVHAIFHSISIWCDSKLQDYYMNFSREPSTFGTVMNLVSVVGVPVMVDYGEIKFIGLSALDKNATRKIKNYVELSTEAAYYRVASTVDLESKMERMHPLALLAKELILVVERELTVYQPEFRHCCPAAGIVSATKLNKLYEEQLYYRPEILKVDNGFIRSVEPEGRFGQQSSWYFLSLQYKLISFVIFLFDISNCRVIVGSIC